MKDGSTDAIHLTIHYDRALYRRALTAWWQSVVPPSPFAQRVIFWAIVWFLIGMLTLGLSALGLSPMLVAAGLIGAGFLVGVFGYLQRTRMNKFWNVLEAHWDKAGETEARISPSGLVFEDAVSRRALSWPAIDAIRGAKGVTTLRTAFQMIAIPDTSLPEGMTGQMFRDQMRAWRDA